jgi:type 1 glutamine amidotransferase
MTRSISLCVMLAAITSPLAAQDAWVVYKGTDGPGKGKKIVLVSGDEEYRSEEMLPQLGKILAKRHGFDCSVHFAIDKNGTINPGVSNIPGLEALKNADLMVLFTRFRNLPDEQMKHLVDYIESGRPIVGLRTATHAFANIKNNEFSKYNWNNNDKAYKGGFGRQVLGETWVNHHGAHGREATRGIIAKGAESHPILRGIKNGDIFGPTDVYTVNLPPDCTPLVMGEVVAGMKADDPPVIGKKNDPMMPIAWTRLHKANGKEARIFTTTLANGQDFLSEGTRRMTVNAVFWAVGLEDRIPTRTNVDLVGNYQPPSFRDGHRKGVRPADLQ